MDLTDISNLFESYQQAIDGLNSFKFDDISSLNKKDKRNYKLLLLNPPDSTLPDITQLEYEHYAIQFFVLDTFKTAEKKQSIDLAQKWSETGKLAKQVVDKMRLETTVGTPPGEAILVGTPAIVRGHHLHNHDLVGVQVNAIWRIFECL